MRRPYDPTPSENRKLHNEDKIISFAIMGIAPLLVLAAVILG